MRDPWWAISLDLSSEPRPHEKACRVTDWSLIRRPTFLFLWPIFSPYFPDLRSIAFGRFYNRPFPDSPQHAEVSIPTPLPGPRFVSSLLFFSSLRWLFFFQQIQTSGRLCASFLIVIFPKHDEPLVRIPHSTLTPFSFPHPPRFFLSFFDSDNLEPAPFVRTCFSFYSEHP